MRLPGLETVDHSHIELSSEDTVGRLWRNDGFLRGSFCVPARDQADVAPVTQ